MLSLGPTQGGANSRRMPPLRFPPANLHSGRGAEKVRAKETIFESNTILTCPESWRPKTINPTVDFSKELSHRVSLLIESGFTTPALRLKKQRSRSICASETQQKYLRARGKRRMRATPNPEQILYSIHYKENNHFPPSPQNRGFRIWGLLKAR